jgi:hypothetical protein
MHRERDLHSQFGPAPELRASLPIAQNILQDVHDNGLLQWARLG